MMTCSLCKFRFSIHELPVERDRYNDIQIDRRFCHLCNENMIGDNFHFILECADLQQFRK